MIPTVALWMSYERDALPLAASVAYFRALNPGIPVYIAHDAARPIPNHLLDEIAPEFVAETTFETRTKLYGWEPLRAVLEAIQSACEAAGARSAVKIDSDTLVDLAGWYSPHFPWVGAEGGNMPLGRGMACGIQPGTAAAVWDALTNDRWFEPGFRPPEDSVIYAEAARLFPGTKLHLRRSLVGALMVGYDWRNQDGFERYRASRVITFGNRGHIPGGRDGCEAIMAAKMRDFTAWKTGRATANPDPNSMIHFLSVPRNASHSVRAARIPGLRVHGHEADGSALTGEIIAIRRDPVERFESAYWYLRGRMPLLFSAAKFTGPSEFAERLAAGDPQAMALFVHNGARQTVGGQFVGCDFAFCPQALWLRHATTIIEFGELADYFAERFGVEIPHANRSGRRAAVWSEAGTGWLREFYAADFAMQALSKILHPVRLQDRPRVMPPRCL